MESEPQSSSPHSGGAPRPDPPKRVTLPFPRLARALVPVLVGIAGAWLAIAAFGRGSATLGPFQVGLEAHFGSGEADLARPPPGGITPPPPPPPLPPPPPFPPPATVDGIAIQQLSQTVSESGIEPLVQRVEDEARRQILFYAL